MKTFYGVFFRFSVSICGVDGSFPGVVTLIHPHIPAHPNPIPRGWVFVLQLQFPMLAMQDRKRGTWGTGGKVADAIEKSAKKRKAASSLLQ